MFESFAVFLQYVQRLMQRVALFSLFMVSLALVAFSLAAAVGYVPWPDLSLSFGGQPVENAGMIVQLVLTGLAVSLLFFLPTNARVMNLENSHRAFALSMDDIARAYRVAHEDDRKKLFRIGSEFDSVRERLLHLRDHPDLGSLEPEILELAAQMSHQARDLARIYSDEKVDRARAFLRERQHEVEHVQETIGLAKKTIGELRHWLLQVETEEKIARDQIAVLERDLFDLLPQLGYDVGVEERPVADPNVVPLASRPGISPS